LSQTVQVMAKKRLVQFNSTIAEALPIYAKGFITIDSSSRFPAILLNIQRKPKPPAF